jgi:eukaryotic-like serine/threonine-protein kinase
MSSQQVAASAISAPGGASAVNGSNGSAPPGIGSATGQTTTLVAGKAPGSRPCMALVAGSGLHYIQELAVVLRKRLQLVAFILFVSLSTYLVRAYVAPVEDPTPTHWFMHIATTLIVAICTGLTFFPWRHMLVLRGIELAMFGAVACFFTYLHFTELKLAPLLSGVDAQNHEWIMHQAVSNIAFRWMLLIILYGIFVPNTWQRCLVVVSVISSLPLLTTFYVCSKCVLMGPHGSSAMFDMAVILGIGIATAILGSYKISELQRKAFEAKKLGQYNLVRKLGSGGMGEVWLAEHQLLRRNCAVKTIRATQAGDPLTLQRFEREVQAMAGLTHWNSVEIYDYGHAADGTFYYVMEYLPGLTLQEMVDKNGPLPAARAIHFLRQICAALEEAHGIGLIHRDIKPSNVLVCRRGKVADVAKLLDFGLVQNIASKLPDDKLTMHGAVLGSPPYISPEQARGTQQVDERTDIYGLGGLAYFLATGRAPFERDSALETMAAHLHEKVVPPTALQPNIREDFEAVILRCLEKNPADRFPDVGELDRALAQCALVCQWDADQAEAWWLTREATVEAERDTPDPQQVATVAAQ